MTQYTGLPLGFSNLSVGQAAMTGSAFQLPAAKSSQVILTALKGNSHPIYIGVDDTVSDTTGLEIAPGNSAALAVANLAMLWVLGTVGDSLSYCELV